MVQPSPDRTAGIGACNQRLLSDKTDSAHRRCLTRLSTRRVDKVTPTILVEYSNFVGFRPAVALGDFEFDLLAFLK